MSKKEKRVQMTVALINSLSDISADAKNQTPERLIKNINVMKAHLTEMLRLDNVYVANNGE